VQRGNKKKEEKERGRNWAAVKGKKEKQVYIAKRAKGFGRTKKF